jgi:hypothetical protein
VPSRDVRDHRLPIGVLTVGREGGIPSALRCLQTSPQHIQGMRSHGLRRTRFLLTMCTLAAGEVKFLQPLSGPHEPERLDNHIEVKLPMYSSSGVSTRGISSIAGRYTAGFEGKGRRTGPL